MMTHIIFGGSNGIGQRCGLALKEKLPSKILNIDIKPSQNELYDQEILGDLTSKSFMDEIINNLSTENINSLIWSIRSRAESKNNLEIVKKTLEIELFPLIEIIDRLENVISKSNSKIVVISSIAAQFVSSQHYAYNITKGAVESYVRNIAVNLGRKSNARINILRAGIVSMPERTGSSILNQKILENASVPRLSIVTAEEIGKLVAFLSSNDSSSLNGSTIVADGGESILDQYYVAQLAKNSISENS